MGKKLQEIKPLNIEKNRKIKKSKSNYTKNLSSFLNKIEEDYQHITSDTLIPQIHNLITKNRKKLYFDYRKIS